MKEDNGAMRHRNNTEQSGQTEVLNNTLKSLTNAILGMKESFIKGFKQNATARDMVRNDDNDEDKFKNSLKAGFNKVEKMLGIIANKGPWGLLLAGLGLLFKTFTLFQTLPLNFSVIWEAEPSFPPKLKAPFCVPTPAI